MTSVPKPLKFLRPHLQTLKDTYAKLAEGDNKKLLADIISLLAMTDAPVDNVMPESLRYRLVGSDEDIGTWGHEAGLGTRLLGIARNNLILPLVFFYYFAFLRQQRWFQPSPVYTCFSASTASKWYLQSNMNESTQSGSVFMSVLIVCAQPGFRDWSGIPPPAGRGCQGWCSS